MAIEGDAVWVDTRRQGACGRCSAGCGPHRLDSALSRGSADPIRAYPDRRRARRVRLHDTLELSLPEHSLLRAASLLYALPLLSTLAAAVLADRHAVAAQMSAGAADLQVAVAAGAGLGLGLLLTRAATRRAEANPDHRLRVTGR